jgi:hypothetical protein
LKWERDVKTIVISARRRVQGSGLTFLLALTDHLFEQLPVAKLAI